MNKHLQYTYKPLLDWDQLFLGHELSLYLKSLQNYSYQRPWRPQDMLFFLLPINIRFPLYRETNILFVSKLNNVNRLYHPTPPLYFRNFWQSTFNISTSGSILRMSIVYLIMAIVCIVKYFCLILKSGKVLFNYDGNWVMLKFHVRITENIKIYKLLKW